MNQSHPLPNDLFLGLPGSINFRDFGGYPTRDGRTLKRGLLFRCGAMNAMDAAAHDAFSRLDVGVICDLRRDEEVLMSPTPAHAPFDVRVHIPIDPGSTMHLRASLEDPRQTHEDRRRYMVDITREIAREHVAEYTRVLRELLETDRGFVIHCSAGKDRTGFGVAIIQLALGVTEDVVFQDYLLSNAATELADRMRARMKETQPHVDEDSISVLAGVRREYLEGAFEEVHRAFGGLRGYLEAAGLTDTDIVALRDRYVA